MIAHQIELVIWNETNALIPVTQSHLLAEKGFVKSLKMNQFAYVTRAMN